MFNITIWLQAEDPDTVSEITYVILRGDTELFSIDRKLGLVRTVKALDRETSARYELVIGTEENNGEKHDAFTTVEVLVEVRK